MELNGGVLEWDMYPGPKSSKPWIPGAGAGGAAGAGCAGGTAGAGSTAGGTAGAAVAPVMVCTERPKLEDNPWHGKFECSIS